jgi:hypothetical protein
MGCVLNSPTDATSVLIELLENEPAEVFAILCLTTKHRVIGYHEVSRGTLDSTSAHPREVFRAAILSNAATIVLAHYVARHIRQSIFCAAARRTIVQIEGALTCRDGGQKMPWTKPLHRRSPMRIEWRASPWEGVMRAQI